MSDERPPARPWYDLAKKEASIRGWGIAELAQRAGISRPTIYGWRDNMNPPRPGPVNDAADVLGVDRARALSLAGIIESGSAIPPDTDDWLREGLTREAYEDVIERIRRGRRAKPPAEDSSSGGNQKREAG